GRRMSSPTRCCPSRCCGRGTSTTTSSCSARPTARRSCRRAATPWTCASTRRRTSSAPAASPRRPHHLKCRAAKADHPHRDRTITCARCSLRGWVCSRCRSSCPSCSPGRRRWVPRRNEFVAGVALGLGGVLRQTTALVALALPATRSPSRYFIALAVGLLVGILPLLVFNQLVYGSAVEQGYGVKPFDTPILEGLYGLLLSPSRGLFIYEPWAFLALASCVIARFANTTRGRISERIAGLLIPWAVLLGAYATYAEWWGGRVFGPRFLDDFAPLLIAGLAWGVRGGWFALGFMRGVFWLAVSWSLLLFGAAALVYDQNTWDLAPTNINDDPSRLFSWSDPQWLAVLRALPEGGPRVVIAIGLSLLILLFLARVEGLIGRKGVVIGGPAPSAPDRPASSPPAS